MFNGSNFTVINSVPQMFSEYWQWKGEGRLKDEAEESLPTWSWKQLGYYPNLINGNVRAKSILELEPEFLVVSGLWLGWLISICLPDWNTIKNKV